LFFLRNFLTQKAAGFARRKMIRSPSARSNILLRKKNGPPLLFAKISNVMTNRTFLFLERSSRAVAPHHNRKTLLRCSNLD